MTARAWRASSVTVAVAAAMMIGGCESPLAPTPPSGDVLSGSWTACLTDATGDYRKSIVFYPDASYLVATERHATTDGTCGGAATGESYAPWMYKLGNEAPAYVGPGGTPVTAREMNSMNSLMTIYSIVYEDAHASPPVLYFGDVKLDPVLDGTAATRRPEVLSTPGLDGI